jgi:hypothetical protein
MQSIKKALYIIGYLLVIAAISQATFKTFAYQYAPHLEIFYQITHIQEWKGGNLWSIAKHLLDGTPRTDLPMYTWANRQLAPRIILGISSIGISYREAAIVFYWCGIFVINFILTYTLIKSQKSHKETLGLVILFNYLFIVFHDRTGLGWLYTWDILSIIFFTIFSYCVVNEKPKYYLVILFFIALLNREDAAFIALYILISGFNIKISKLSVNIKNIYSIILGCSLIIVSLAYTKAARDYFAFTTKNNTIGNSVTSLHTALYDLFVRNFSFNNDKFFFNAIDGFWLIASAALAVLIYRNAKQSVRDLIFIYILFILSIIIFGNQAINEIRLYLPLFPIFIFIFSQSNSKLTNEKSPR